MTRLSTNTWCWSTATLSAVIALSAARPAGAQCSTCATPMVAYSPVVVQPVAYSGWYPGKWLDSWGRTAWTTPTYTAAYAPASYAVSYAPYTAAYTPYTAAYATSYLPPASSCSSCAQPAYTPVVASYAPMTVYRPVALTAVSDCGCSACSAAAPCSSCVAEAPCSSCAGAVEQAGYVQPASGCASCAGSVGQIDYSQGTVPSSQGSSAANPQTPIPQLAPNETVPEAAKSPYGTNRPEEATGTQPPAENSAVPGPVAEEPEGDPAAFEAPQLLNPRGDLRANRPTVDVHHAVFRQATPAARVSTAVAQRPAQKTQAEIDADGWYSVPRSR